VAIRSSAPLPGTPGPAWTRRDELLLGGRSRQRPEHELVMLGRLDLP
jgi:hypothetical protein